MFNNIGESKLNTTLKIIRKKDIIDVMGHEIRTPLSIIKQELNYHKEVTLPKESEWKEGNMNSSDVEDLFKTLQTIDEEVDHTLSLVTNMLEAARIDKQRFELNIDKVDIIKLARQTFEVEKKANDSSKYEFLMIDNGLESLEVNVDPVRVRESIDALLTNAVKYGQNIEGGKSIIEMNLRKDEENIYISIKDNGRGIEKEDIEKLGKKFVRLYPKTANLERPGGTGLGLFVVKNIMQYHKGDLLIESEGIGKGSVFTLKFPLNNI